MRIFKWVGDTQGSRRYTIEEVAPHTDLGVGGFWILSKPASNPQAPNQHGIHFSDDEANELLHVLQQWRAGIDEKFDAEFPVRPTRQLAR